MGATRKICLLGDFAVGKTSLVRRYVLGEYSDDYKATVGVNVYKYPGANDGGGSGTPDLVIWDIEGSIANDETIAGYLRGSAGAVIVADVTRPETLEGLRRDSERFSAAVPGRPVRVALNKLDLLANSERVAAMELAADLDGEFRCTSHLTSAKTAEEVAGIFDGLTADILRIGA